ncbi:hypothetical protein EV356DRAFT_469063 [Viridothelium virens]|uniref:RRM domain-containing protein n=1 Tax=Viridothelium virens TaxID=1048519 RepID=A0A6A6H4F9_VIRVR|nr:hypothetical protein EV356DRAFT_469063 [Viridothelium virens]
MAPSRTLFVGNIAYAATEEQITDMLSQVGQRPQFRLILDRESGQPKGFGFATFQDTDAAASAVRNLNNYEFMGRTLRVDYSNENDNDAPPAGYAENAVNGQDNSALPTLPPGTDLPGGLTCTDAISKTLNAMPPPQLLDIISQIKNLVTTDPTKATELLKQAPQLSYAIFQALLLLELVDPQTLTSILQGGGLPQAPAPPAPSAQSQFNPYSQQQYPPYSAMQQPLSVPTPPVQQQPYQPPPAQTPSTDQAQLLQMVMNLSADQINAMPPAEREQIMAVRNQIASGQIRV